MAEPVYLYRTKRPAKGKEESLTKLYKDKDNVQFLNVADEWVLDPGCFGDGTPGTLRGLSASTSELRGDLFTHIADANEDTKLSSSKRDPITHKMYTQFMLYRCNEEAWGGSSWHPRADPTATDTRHFLITPALPGPDDAFRLEDLADADWEGDVGGDAVKAAMPKPLYAKVPEWNWVGAVRMKAQACALWEHMRDRDPSPLKTVAYALRAVEEDHEDAETAISASCVAAKIKEQVDAGCDLHGIGSVLEKQDLQAVLHALDFVIHTDDCDHAVDAVAASRTLRELSGA